MALKTTYECHDTLSMKISYPSKFLQLAIAPMTALRWFKFPLRDTFYGLTLPKQIMNAR
jgi:hypothetical protein